MNEVNIKGIVFVSPHRNYTKERKIMKYTKKYIELHIQKLEENPIANANLIRKWKRMLKRAEN